MIVFPPLELYSVITPPIFWMDSFGRECRTLTLYPLRRSCAIVFII
jgi:hypothetical protein